MHRLLERLDGAAATLVPLLYLAGLALGAAAYFAGVTLDAGLAVGVALAIAAELHSFLQQRRVRAAWAQLQRLADDAPEREALAFSLKVNAWILAGLLTFSAYNAIAFAAATWRPSPGFLPPWLQIGVRGLIVPIFFFLSGFLAPLHTDASEQLRATSADMLRRTLRAVGKQWRGRLDDARRQRADLAPIAIALLQDAGDAQGARRVELVAAGLTASEGRQSLPVALPEGAQMALATTPDTSAVRSASERAPDEPPDGGGGGLPQDHRTAPPAPMGPEPTPFVRSRGKRRPKPAAIRKRDRAAAEALQRERRARAFALLDADPMTTPNKIARELHCNWRAAYSLVESWQQQRESQGA